VNQSDSSAVGDLTEWWGNCDYEADPDILDHDLRSERERGGDRGEDS